MDLVIRTILISGFWYLGYWLEYGRVFTWGFPLSIVPLFLAGYAHVKGRELLEAPGMLLFVVMLPIMVWYEGLLATALFALASSVTFCAGISIALSRYSPR